MLGSKHRSLCTWRTDSGAALIKDSLLFSVIWRTGWDTRQEETRGTWKRAVTRTEARTILDRASGYHGQRSRLYRKAKGAGHSLAGLRYDHRRKKKGDFRRLWIQRINAASHLPGA